MKITVKPAFNDSGNCREYFWATLIELPDGRSQEPSKLLLCKQEEAEGVFNWYRACNDGCWYEPESLIKSFTTVVSEDGEVLKVPSAEYLDKQQVWEEEMTVYWFQVNDERVGVAESGCALPKIISSNFEEVSGFEFLTQLVTEDMRRA